MKAVKNMVSILFCVYAMFISCSSSTFSLVVENKTGATIKDLRINVQGKEYIIGKLNPFSIRVMETQKDSLHLNKHDFRIETSHNNKDGVLISGFYYSDLSGYPKAKYRIEIYDSITLVK